MRSFPVVALPAVALSGLLLAGCSGGRVADEPTTTGNLEALIDPGAKACVVNDERRSIGAGLDASGPLEVQVPGAASASGACAGNTDYLLGTGLHDVTGVIADTASPAWVNPQQVFHALHSRLYARAFALESPCNGRRVMFVSIDTGLMSSALREAVLAEIAADETLAGRYDARNVMLSVTHTHSDPNTGLVSSNNGLQVLAGGTFDAIRKADANLRAQPETGQLRLSSGELLNTNINRSKPAYANNPAIEREEFLNDRGEETQVNKRMLQLELYRDNGEPAGLINWFGVHPTVIGPSQFYVSGDVKGEAALGFEALMGTDYRAAEGASNFVAAFAQADEGDSSPNIFIEQFPHPDPRRGGGVDDLDANAISAHKQLARAVELYGTGAPVRGPVDFRLLNIPIASITIDDPTVLASLNHPPELDAAVKRTCSGVLGASFGAGAEDGPGPTTEGLTCSDGPDVLAAAVADIETITGLGLEGFPGGWPTNLIPGQTGSTAAMCNVALLPPVLGDFTCQAEKPVLLPRGADELPLQLFRIGNLAILGVPWEVTTTSARRLRRLLLTELGTVGVDTMVVAGLVNDYVHYLTTREEYATQQYEGASTLYGPWTLAAVQQEALRMARTLREGTPGDPAPSPASRSDLTLADGPIDLPNLNGPAGTVISQPASNPRPGESVSAQFVAGHPGNDLRLQESFVTVERQTASGEWEVFVEDRDPRLLYIWNALVPLPVAAEPPLSTSGNAEVRWDIPRNTPAGSYRFRIDGSTRTAAGVASYQGLSAPFMVADPVDDCP